MENTSKALLIAAAVLIVILIIAFGLKIFNSTSETASETKKAGKIIYESTGDVIDKLSKDMPVFETDTKESIIKYVNNNGDFVSAENIKKGEKIQIGEKESFTVASNDGQTIIAIPNYNVTITSSNTEISFQSENSGLTIFSSAKYWGNAINTNIDLSGADKIQQTINAYKRNLENIGAKNVKVRMPTYDDIKNLNGKQRNPGQKSNYWLASVNSKGQLLNVNASGALSNNPTLNSTNGVRPIIEIRH